MQCDLLNITYADTRNCNCNLSFCNLTILVKELNTTQKLFHIFCVFTFYFNIPFIPFGILFNLLSLLIFSRTSISTTTSTRVYYLVMAFSELTTVFMKDFWFFWLGLGFPTIFGIDPLSVIRLNPHSDSSLPQLCNIMIYIYLIHEMVANMTFILFAMERVIALYYPLFALYWFNTVRALKAIAILIIVSIIVCLITFWLHRQVPLSGLVPSGFLCTQDIQFRDPLINALASFLYLSVFILPALLSATCSILIIIKMISRYINLLMVGFYLNTFILKLVFNIGSEYL